MQVHGGPLLFQLLHAAPGLADQVGIEPAAQTAIRRDEHQRHAAHPAGGLTQ